MADFDPDKFLEQEETEFTPESFLQEESVVEPQVGIGEALFSGAKQGATFGFGDELAGAMGGLSEFLSRSTGGMDIPAEDIRSQLSPEAQARAEKVGIEIEPIEAEQKSLEDVYKEYRDLSREQTKAAEEQRPISTTVGGVLGGFAVPGGMVASGTRGLKGIEAARQAAKTGMAAGALAGAGTSEEELLEAAERPEVLGEFAEDIAGSTALGGLLGYAIPGITSKAKQLSEGVRKLGGIVAEETVGPTAESFKRGLGGELIVGEEARRGLEKQLREFGEEIAPGLRQASGRLAGSKRKILERASKRGDKLDLDKQVQEASDAIERLSELDEVGISEKLRLRKLMDRFREGYSPNEVTPDEANLLRRSFAKLSKLGDKSLQDPDTAAVATRAAQEIGDVVKEVPGVRTADKRIAAFHRAMKTLGVKDMRNIDEQKILDKLTQIIRRQQQEGTAAEKARRVADDFLHDLKIASPKMAQRIEPQINDLATKADITNIAARPVYIPRPLATLEAYAVKGGNLAGYGIREMTPNSMIRTAGQLKNMGTATADKLSESLQRAASKDQRGRNAIMFGIMQNPEYRELLRRVQGEDETGEIPR